ncbi:hypothetical protein ABZY81_42415 [Streptomyces sp. NPDC006514]|uniref:hypothetical protein n=1 Tax=Streptomyces sp. NPDC006514 TaxID=3154308 RepID=UPI0033AAC069
MDAVTEHMRRVWAHLAAEPDLAARIANGRLAVVGARYELTSLRANKVSRLAAEGRSATAA